MNIKILMGMSSYFLSTLPVFLYDWSRIFSLTYHKIKKKRYLCILYDMLMLWQRVQWGLNCPENWSRRCRLLASK